MSNLYYGGPHQHSAVNAYTPHINNSHGGRSRRAPRIPSYHQANNRVPRPSRSPKMMVEVASVSTYRRDFEAARSFDLEDDELFCPFHLLTEDDLFSIHSSGSDRSSLSSGSPESSPLQPQVQPTPNLVLPPGSMNFNRPSSMPTPSSFSATSHPKLHQPLAQRARNAIPIVDPTTRSVASPPSSVSPGRQVRQQFIPWKW